MTTRTRNGPSSSCASFSYVATYSTERFHSLRANGRSGGRDRCMSLKCHSGSGVDTRLEKMITRLKIMFHFETVFIPRENNVLAAQWFYASFIIGQEVCLENYGLLIVTEFRPVVMPFIYIDFPLSNSIPSISDPLCTLVSFRHMNIQVQVLSN